MAELTEDRVKELITGALSSQQESAEAKARADKERQDAIEAAVAEKLDAAKLQAVKEYKEKQKLGASRADIISGIVAYVTAEAKTEAIELLAEMSQADFERHQKDTEKDKELADLRAKLKAEPPAEPVVEGDKLPAVKLTARQIELMRTRL